MAKIKLNNNEYPIPDSKLAGPTADFIAHLGTIAGNGLKVVVGGVEYGVDATKVAGAVAGLEGVLGGLNNPDTPTPEERLEGDGAEFYTLAPTALSFRSTAPLNELQEVQINGVTVDPSNYTLEEGSTIVTFPIDYLKTLSVGNYEVAVASQGKTVKGDFSVKAPELNEYGFYYNQPYVGYVDILGGNTSLIVGRVSSIICFQDGSETTALHNISEGAIELYTDSDLGTLHMTILEDGAGIYNIETGTTFVLNGALAVADEDYLYLYSEEWGGYTAITLDSTMDYKNVYGAIKTGIFGRPTVALGRQMFQDNTLMIDCPIIPNGVTRISGEAFCGCVSLTNITMPSSITFIGGNAFGGCETLTNINFEGTMAQWNAITKGDYWNQRVPATYVQCSDGQVAL